MNNEEFKLRTNSIIPNKQFATVNSVHELRVSLSLYNHLPDVVTLYKQGGIKLIENIEEELLLIQSFRETIAGSSHHMDLARKRLKALLKKEKP